MQIICWAISYASNPSVHHLPFIAWLLDLLPLLSFTTCSPLSSLSLALSSSLPVWLFHWIQAFKGVSSIQLYQLFPSFLFHSFHFRRRRTSLGPPVVEQSARCQSRPTVLILFALHVPIWSLLDVSVIAVLTLLPHLSYLNLCFSLSVSFSFSLSFSLLRLIPLETLDTQ